MITEKLQNWINTNHLTISELDNNGSDIVVVNDKRYLYLKPTDGKVIDEDFAFILSDEEFDLLESKEVDYILFEFGERFYYSELKKDKNRYNEEIYKPQFNDFKYLGENSEDDIIPNFAHLGIHSEYEIMNGSADPSVWVQKAKFLRCSAIGICDKNTLSGTLPFQTACEKKGIKSIIGETISVVVDYTGEEMQEKFELILYVTNLIGWKNLLQINRCINVEHNKFVTEEELFRYSEGLICVIAKNSYLNYHKEDRKRCYETILKYKKQFKSGLYYQIDTVEYSGAHSFQSHLENIDFYMRYYSKLLPPILINDSYYLDKEQSILKGTLNKIAGVVNPESEDQFFKSINESILSYEEWYEEVGSLLDLILKSAKNAIKMSNGVEFRIPTNERKLPEYKTKDVKKLFYNEVEKGFQEHFGNLTKQEQEKYRLELLKEFNVIVPNGLCDYFMILWDIINWCRENEIMVGVGRGSVCGSLVAYCLNITAVDPLKYNLMFERFLNETRVSGERAKSADSMPDIDCDFPTEYRDIVKEYIAARYGRNHTCSIGTYTRLKLKTCIKDFAKLKGLSFDYTNKLTKNIDDQVEYTWGDLIEYACNSKMLFEFVQQYPEIVHLTKYALLQPKTESVHPSAVVIVPDKDSSGNSVDLYGWLPIKQIDGLLVSEWEGKYIDKSGFLKEDILGLSQLDKFSSMLKLIKKNCGKWIDVNKIPFDDQEVFKYFRRGWCEDVFQFGSNGLMNYCRQAKPTTLEDLIAMNALFRPGPMDIGAHQDFVDFKNGKKKPQYDYAMDEVTKNTFGLYVYQEQIMKAVVVAGLSQVQSDVLRTTIKKKDFNTLNSFKEQFIDGYVKLLQKGNIKDPEKYADKVWNKLLSFAGYGFNKSHAAAYTIMGYWSQWFKVNYPLEFWTTSLQFATEAEVPYRLAEMKKTGVDIEIRPPDVNYSEKNFTCDAGEQRIFFSINKIKQVGDVAVENILKTREEGGRFFSLEEFCSRVPKKVNKRIIVHLIIAGAFDMIEDIRNPRERRKLLQQYLESKGDKLPEAYRGEEAQTNAFWILEQKKLTGFGEIDYESMIRESIPNKRVAKMYVNDIEFLGAKENDEVTIAGRLMYYHENETKNGTMCGMQIDCNNTIIYFTAWPDFYKDIKDEIEDIKGCLIAVCGTVKKDKFKGDKRVYSNNGTRLFIINSKID